MSPFTETHSVSAGQNGVHRKFLSEAHQDLVSQAGRIIPDLQTIRKLGQTAFNGGLIDDRKYLVCIDPFAPKCKSSHRPDRKYHPDHGIPAQYLHSARFNHGYIHQYPLGQPPASSIVLSRRSIQISNRRWKLQRTFPYSTGWLMN